MAQALGNPDPYYFAENALQGQNQAKALGQTNGLTPQALTSAIDENFKAQQANLVTQKNIQMQNKSLALDQSKFDEQKSEFKQAQSNQMWQGVGSLATSILGKYIGTEAGSVAVGELAGGASDAFGSIIDTIGGWLGGLI